MEDRYIVTSCDVDGQRVVVAGVFDGHGGKAVAKFCADNVIRAFQKSFLTIRKEGNDAPFGSKIVKTALTATFVSLDEMMTSREGRAEIRAAESASDSAKRPRIEEKTGGSATSYEGNAGWIRMRGLQNENPTPEMMGSTGCVCVLVPTHDATRVSGWAVVCANAGDSRSVMCRAGKAIALSEDHKPDAPNEKKRILAAGGSVSYSGRVCGNLNLSRALGDTMYKDFSKPAAEHIISCVPDITVTQMTTDDEFLIIGCDGCYEVHDRQKVVNFVRHELAGFKIDGPKLVKVCCDFLDTSISKTGRGPGCDNMTIVVVQFRAIAAEATKK